MPGLHAVKHLARTRLVARQQGDPRSTGTSSGTSRASTTGTTSGYGTTSPTYRRSSAGAKHSESGSRTSHPSSAPALEGRWHHGLLRSTACTIARPYSARKLNVIDRLREQIEERLDQLVHEADRLRKALAALGPGSSSAPPTTPAPRGRATTTRKAPSGSKPTPARRTSTPRGSRRTPQGATKASVLAALDGGEAMTAGEVATKAGLRARPSRRRSRSWRSPAR